MTLVLNISDKPEEDKVDRTLLTPQQQAFNEFMKWQLFLQILSAICLACGYSLEYGDDTDASCAIFADAVGAKDADDTWQQEALFEPPF